MRKRASASAFEWGREEEPRPAEGRGAEGSALAVPFMEDELNVSRRAEVAIVERDGPDREG